MRSEPSASTTGPTASSSAAGLPMEAPDMAGMRAISASEDQDDSRSSSSSNSPAPADNEESDFFLNNNDSQSSLGVPNIQDMQVDDACWPPVNRLPNEILISIFSRLGNPTDLFHCMLVSHRWARNAVDLLWHRPACTNWKNHGSICQTLGFDHPFFSYKDFIRRLNLANIAEKVNDGSVRPLAVCPRLERLTLTNCRGLTDSGLIALVENSHNLLALDISNDKHITEQSINIVAANCKRLQGLNISGCNNISNESMITLAENCKFIKRLKLNECAQLRDDAIMAFANNCPNILEIDLHQCAQIGNAPITSLLAQGKCLRELRLANCDLIDDKAFLDLPAKTFDHLRILDMTSCTHITDVAVKKIIEAAPRLRNLVLAKCRLITDAAVHAISRLGKNLHYVHLGHCSAITDEGVKKLILCCNRIRYIDLGCLVNLTDDSVKRLAVLPKLKRIGLVKCSNITDDSILTLADYAWQPRWRRDASGINKEMISSSLERVHLSYCVNLTLKSILRLLNSCPRLTHLSLTGVAAFQRDEFQPFCRTAPLEFTQHQRDVFCVFSGGMVAQFRNFLNTDPSFSELRRSALHPSLRRLGNPTWTGTATMPSSRPHGHSNAPEDGDGPDDEMADEENDFEDASDMMLDPQGQHTASLPLPINGGNQTIPPPGGPFHLPASFPASTHHLLQQSIEHGILYESDFAPGGHLNYSSFMSNQPARGAPPLSTHGQVQASMANVGQVPFGGPASVAPMHQHVSQHLDEDETQDQIQPQNPPN